MSRNIIFEIINMFFILIFFILHILSDNNRNIIPLFHSCTTGGIALIYLPYLLSENTNIINTNDLGEFCASVTLQFMIYDLINCGKIEYVFHHILAIIASSYVMYTRNYETLVLYIEVNEVSTIFLNLAYLNILKNTNEFLFVITFILCRIIWLPWIIIYKEVNGILLYIMYLHYILQLFWLFKIFKKIGKLLR